MCLVAIDLSLETTYELTDLVDMPADAVMGLYARHTALKFEQYRLMIPSAGRVGVTSQDIQDWTGTPGSHPSIPDKYRTGRSEVSLGGGKKRVTQRINIMDLWDHPELMGSITNPQ